MVANGGLGCEVVVYSGARWCEVVWFEVVIWGTRW